MKRSRLARTKPLQRRETPMKRVAMKRCKRLRTVSVKQQARNDAYAPVKDEYLAAHPWCEVDGCGAPSAQVHHRRKREGDNLTNKKKLMATCTPCHNLIHRETGWAYENGYLESQHTKMLPVKESNL